MFSAGRWHSVGRPIVYTAESSALALLEALVHVEDDAVPDPYQLLMIDAPDGMASHDFPADAPPQDQMESGMWGDAWLTSGATAFARVPAAVAPYSSNWLINPRHPDAMQIEIIAHGRWPWDRRLFR